MQQNSYN